MTRRAPREVCDTRTFCSGLRRRVTGALQEVRDTRTSCSAPPRVTRGAPREVCDATTSRSARPCEARAAFAVLGALRPHRGRPRRASSGPPRPPARRRRAPTGALLLLRRRRENPRGAPPDPGAPRRRPRFKGRSARGRAPIPETLGRPGAEPEGIARAGREAHELRLGPERRLRAGPSLLVGRALPVVRCLPRDRAGEQEHRPLYGAMIFSPGK